MPTDTSAPEPHQLQALMQSTGWSTSEVSRQARVAPRTVQQWIAGDRGISQTAWDLLRIRAGWIDPGPLA